MAIGRRAKALRVRVENAKSPFVSEVLNTITYVLPLDREALRNHARVEIDANYSNLNKNKIRGDGVISRFADKLYYAIKSSIEDMSVPGVTVSKAGSKDRAIIKQYPANVELYKITGTQMSAGMLGQIVRVKIVNKAKKASIEFLNSIKLQAAEISTALDVTPMLMSDPGFKSTIRELTKAAEFIPKEKRARYIASVKRYAQKAVKDYKSKTPNKDWAMDVRVNTEVSTRKVAASGVIALTFTGSATGAELKKKKEAATKALLDLSQKEYQRLLTKDTGLRKQVSQLLVDSVIDSITLKRRNKNNKGRFVSRKEVLKGITSSGPMRGKSAIWRAKGREALKDVTKNLLGIRNVINTYMFEHMQRNMGKGNSKTVLNYRTGRLARSAEVVTVHPTRGDMITATVNYMQDPYSIYAPGGDRDIPRTRDPKLLIDKSIRQILTEKLKLALSFKSELL